MQPVAFSRPLPESPYPTRQNADNGKNVIGGNLTCGLTNSRIRSRHSPTAVMHTVAAAAVAAAAAADAVKHADPYTSEIIYRHLVLPLSSSTAATVKKTPWHTACVICPGACYFGRHR